MAQKVLNILLTQITLRILKECTSPAAFHARVSKQYNALFEEHMQPEELSTKRSNKKGFIFIHKHVLQYDLVLKNK